MDRSSKIVLAGVWEQVNIPICICIERGIFKKYGVDVEFRRVPEGTGKMLDMIEEGSVDLAITVADAFIAGKAKGRSIQLCGAWVKSPLIWAIAGADSRLPANDNTPPTFNELGKRKINNNETLHLGISRLGSGSHTMAFYLAQQNNVPKHSLSFGVENDFVGLRKAVNNGTVDAFLWEVFTTKPFFDNQELTYLGEVATPWPAFVFVSQASKMSDSGSDSDSAGVHEVKASDAGSGLSKEKARLIRECLYPALAEGVAIFQAEAQMAFLGAGKVPPSIQRIMGDFGHTELDAWAWFNKCRYSVDASMRVDYTQMLQSVETLKTVGLVPDKFTVEKLWTSVTGEVNPVITTELAV